MMRNRVIIGKDFEIDAANIDGAINVGALYCAHVDRERGNVRKHLAYGIFVAAALAFATAFGVEFLAGRAGAVHAVWDTISVPLTAIISYYFATLTK